MLFRSSGPLNIIGDVEGAAAEVHFSDSVMVTGDIGQGGVDGDSGDGTTFTVSGEGTATWTSKAWSFVKVGPLVILRFQFIVNNAGSGASTVQIANPGWPLPAGTIQLLGDRGGAGVRPVAARIDTTGDVISIKTVDDNTIVTGANLAAGASYNFTGAYIAA